MLTDDVAAVGIGAAGLVELEGRTAFAPNLAWRDVPLAEHIGARSASRRSPTTTRTRPPGASTASARVAGTGTCCLVDASAPGIGGGIVADGRLFRGRARVRGRDRSHHRGARRPAVRVREPRVLGAGRRAARRSSGRAAAAASGTRTRRSRSSPGAIPDARDGRAGHRAARDGDDGLPRDPRGGRPAARVRGSPGLVNMLDPEIVVVGGGAAEAGDLLLEPARERVPRRGRGAEIAPTCRSCRRPSATTPARRGGGAGARARWSRAAREARPVAAGLHRRPARPLGVAARAAAARLRRAVRPRPPIPAGVTAAGADRPSLEAFTTLVGGGGAHPGCTSERSSRASTLRGRDAGEAGGGARRDSRRAGGPRARHRRPGLGRGAREFGFPFPPRPSAAHARGDRRALRALFGGRHVAGRRARAGDHRPAAAARRARDLGRRAVRRRARGRGARRRRVERVGPRRRGVRRERGHAADARGRTRRLATWAGIALVGEDRADLERLLPSARRGACRPAASGPAPPRSCAVFVERLGDGGATWCVVLPAGPADRLDVIAAALLPMNSAELKRAKRAVRRRGPRRRDAMPAGPTRASWRPDRRALPRRCRRCEARGVVMAFWSFGSELPTGAAHRGARTTGRHGRAAEDRRGRPGGAVRAAGDR